MWDSWGHATKGLHLSSEAIFVTSVVRYMIDPETRPRYFILNRFRGRSGPLVLEFFKKWSAGQRDWWANWPTSTLLKKGLQPRPWIFHLPQWVSISVPEDLYIYSDDKRRVSDNLYNLHLCKSVY